jgi:hypothetical protein
MTDVPNPPLPEKSASQIRRKAPLWAAIALLLVGGLVVWSGRRFLAASVRISHDALARLPENVGDWRGEAQTIDAHTLRVARVENYWLRRYTQPASGRVITTLLVAGRPADVLAHTPEVCYPAQGYTLTGKVGRYERPGALFYAAKFAQRDAPVPSLLEVLWTRNMRGRWEGPDHPDLVFANGRSMAKLYVVFDSATDGLAPDEETVEFIRLLLDQLEDVLPRRR